jgi:hypothetical protein
MTAAAIFRRTIGGTTLPTANVTVRHAKKMSNVSPTFGLNVLPFSVGRWPSLVWLNSHDRTFVQFSQQESG